MAPIGMPAGIRIASHCSYVLARNVVSSAAINAGRFALRAALLTNRGSSASSGCSISGQNARHSLSLPIPTAISRVFVRNV